MKPEFVHRVVAVGLSSVLTAPCVALWVAPPRAAQVVSHATAPFPNFESSPVHPLALTPDGARLVALNTSDARVEVFDVQPNGTLVRAGSVFTGLDPVSVCIDPANPTRAFVANQVSDDVAVVDLATLTVSALIPVGDEPSDVLVANGKLFVACARSASNPQLLAPTGFVEHAVVIASASAPYAIQTRIAIQGHKPRALALAKVAGQQRVFVVPQNSGNHTTTLEFAAAKTLGLADPTVADAFDPPFQFNPSLKAPGLAGFGGLPPFFPFPISGWTMPQVSRIVNDFEHPSLVPQLADKDVFSIDPATNVLYAQATTGVGTTLFSVERNPLTGELWIAHTAAKNRTRFEPHVKGDAVDNRIAIVAPGGAVLQQVELAPPLTSREHAQPAAIAFYAPPRTFGSGSGSGLQGGHGTPPSAPTGGSATSGPGSAQPLDTRPTHPIAYVACLGSSSVVALDAQSAEFVDEIDVGEVPVGLAVDSTRAVLYVLSRGDHALRAFDIADHHAPLALGTSAPIAVGYDPEPQGVRVGRTHLYDARASTGHGTDNFSCATCHVSGHMDQLAWDLGDPEGGIGYYFADLMTGSQSQGGAVVAAQNVEQTHPLKGPMVTQSLRGLADSNGAPLHWRGDRRFFQMFQGAFVGLLGGTGISNAAMQEYANFVRSLTYPPNPYQPRDRQYLGNAQTGRTLFGLTAGNPGKDYNPLAAGLKCITCHKADFAGGTDFTGAQRTVNFDAETMFFNTPTLRGVYEKQFRSMTGFGTAHDGSGDDIRDFFELPDAFFGLGVFSGFTGTDKSNVSEFVKQWDSGLSPLVGLQQRATASNQAEFNAWLDLAETQAKLAAPWVNVVGRVKTLSNAALTGISFEFDTGSSQWRYRKDDGTWTDRAALTANVLGAQTEVVFTAVPPGTGRRLGIDRDEDGLFDGSEAALGTNPASPDTDLDGYGDALEVSLGSNPLVFTPNLPADAIAPVIQQVQPRDLFATTATLRVQTSEAATALVELGLAAGSYTLPSVTSSTLRSVHDVVLTGLPAKATVFYRVTSKDKNQNAAQATGSFGTTARMLHVDDITLTKTPSGAQWQVTATVKVVDQDGVAVANCAVRGIWAGDIGGQQFFPTVNTNASGIATFALNPYTPSAATTVSFSPGYIGSTTSGNAFFVGTGGSTPNIFYQQPANKVNYRSVAVP
jgi:YVTN family beta-propeller protein